MFADPGITLWWPSAKGMRAPYALGRAAPAVRGGALKASGVF
eukprot:COSAG06_NODE_3743_length_4953_cov_2.166049_3_plen_42_part_00